MGKRSNKTTKTTKTTRTEAQIRADLDAARKAEHAVVEAVKGKHDEKGIARGWDAVERTNALFRELAMLGLGPLAG
jgi:FixJ family two-component response regulator